MYMMTFYKAQFDKNTFAMLHVCRASQASEGRRDQWDHEEIWYLAFVSGLHSVMTLTCCLKYNDVICFI